MATTTTIKTLYLKMRLDLCVSMIKHTHACMLSIPLDIYLISFDINISKPYAIEVHRVNLLYAQKKRIEYPQFASVSIDQRPKFIVHSFIHSFERTYTENVHVIDKCVTRTMSYFLLNPINNHLFP